MNLQNAIELNHNSHLLILVTGTLSILFSSYFYWLYYQVQKRYVFQLGVLLTINGMSMIMRFIYHLDEDDVARTIASNWMIVLTFIFCQWMHGDLLKLICVASTFWTVQKVQIYKYISCILVLFGFVGRLLSKIVFTLGDRSFLDKVTYILTLKLKWNSSISSYVSTLIQICALIQGIYMTFLMKSICNLKDEKSRSNFEKYLNRSYFLLATFILSNILASIMYIIGTIVKGPKETIYYYFYSTFLCIGLFFFAIQLMSLSLLFESIKSMKFGPDSDRKKTVNTR
ncbi:hypothetical protein BC833DRAFT_353497 [Globomyces pollinis-pini]|nr:hypothetical protein BC833DRAFT_353497 [Globomyces pollinis-pini]